MIAPNFTVLKLLEVRQRTEAKLSVHEAFGPPQFIEIAVFAALLGRDINILACLGFAGTADETMAHIRRPERNCGKGHGRRTVITLSINHPAILRSDNLNKFLIYSAKNQPALPNTRASEGWIRAL